MFSLLGGLNISFIEFRKYAIHGSTVYLTYLFKVNKGSVCYHTIILASIDKVFTSVIKCGKYGLRNWKNCLKFITVAFHSPKQHKLHILCKYFYLTIFFTHWIPNIECNLKIFSPNVVIFWLIDHLTNGTAVSRNNISLINDAVLLFLGVYWMNTFSFILSNIYFFEWYNKYNKMQ